MKTFIAEAFGRINLIGEHTDYSGGYVLPTAVPQKARVELSPCTGSEVHAYRNVGGEAKEASFILGAEKPTGSWIDIVQGVTRSLARAGNNISGFTVRIESTVPDESGLSPNAALEVALLRALREAFALKIDDLEVAQLAQAVEKEFIGAKIGIMNQMAASLAQHGEALFVDTRNLHYTRVPLPLDAFDIIVIHSGIPHGDTSEIYHERRKECAEASRLLGLSQLRDCGIAQLKDGRNKMPEPLFRRARHVVTENDRVLKTVDALAKRDLAEVGRFLNESHRSLRDDFEVSHPELDLLAEVAQSHSRVFGARIAGGGFGGAIIALTEYKCGREIGNRVMDAFHSKIRQSRAAVLMPMH